MSAIVTQMNVTALGGGVVEKGILLAGSELTRKFAFGADWEHIAVGWYGGVDANANVSLSDTAWRVGLTTNAAPDINDASPHWVGWCGTGTLGYYTGYNYYNTLTSNRALRRRSGSEDGISTYAFSSRNYLGSRAASGAGYLTRCHAGLVSFERTDATHITVTRGVLGYSFQGGTGPSYDSFVTGLVAGSVSGTLAAWDDLTQNQSASHSFTSIEINEATDGDLDSVSYIWEPVAQKLWLGAIGVCKWA